MVHSKFLFFTFVFFVVFSMKAQDGLSDAHDITITVPAVALVDIEPSANKNISLSFTAPDEAGLPLTNPLDDTSLWLNYSSIITSPNTRSISVSINSLYPGGDIKVVAAADAGNGGGAVGTPSAQLTLTQLGQTIISDIGSAYTGDGASNGHNLTYSLTPTAVYSLLVPDTGTTLTVTYTITNN